MSCARGAGARNPEARRRPGAPARLPGMFARPFSRPPHDLRSRRASCGGRERPSCEVCRSAGGGARRPLPRLLARGYHAGPERGACPLCASRQPCWCGPGMGGSPLPVLRWWRCGQVRPVFEPPAWRALHFGGATAPVCFSVGSDGVAPQRDSPPFPHRGKDVDSGIVFRSPRPLTPCGVRLGCG